MARKAGKLTARQERFVKEYLIDLNATQAAIRAGYSEKTARSAAQRMLTFVDVRAAIDEARMKRGEQYEVMAAKVIETLCRIAFADCRNLMKAGGIGKKIIDCLTDDQVAALEVEIAKGNCRVRQSEKMKALELLSKHFGLLPNNATQFPKMRAEILGRYRAGEISLKEAAIEFEKNGLPLQETIRILLAKEQPEPEDPTRGEYIVISDEEMEARIAKKLEDRRVQIEGLSERRIEVRELRAQVRDTFSPEAIGAKDVEKDDG